MHSREKKVTWNISSAEVEVFNGALDHCRIWRRLCFIDIGGEGETQWDLSIVGFANLQKI